MLVKRLFDLIVSFLALLLLMPLMVIISGAILISSGPPFIFSQKRSGKGRKVFTMYKFRTMVPQAEEIIEKYKHLNEADGPVFKIWEDPRYTKFGKVLAHSGFDELPQLINLLKGQMSLVGPRPLPVLEADKIPKKYQKRFSVLPGITSNWIVAGSHKLSFDEWMKLDLEYVKHWTIKEDIKIFLSTCLLMIKWSLDKLVYWK